MIPLPTFEELIRENINKTMQDLLPIIVEQVEKELEKKKQFKEISQTLFSQKQLAQKWGKSVTTIVNYRKRGMPYQLSPTGGLEFDINKAEKWRRENTK